MKTTCCNIIDCIFILDIVGGAQLKEVDVSMRLEVRHFNLVSDYCKNVARTH